jgi:hypothetical protein
MVIGSWTDAIDLGTPAGKAIQKLADALPEADSPAPEKTFERQADVFRDLAKQDRREVPAGMVDQGGASSVGMPLLLVRAALADEKEAQRFEQPCGFTRLEDGWLRHSATRPR